MLICAECLNDEEMQKAILYDPSSKIGACDASGQSDKKVVNIDIFADFFDAFLSVFIPDPKGSDIVGLIQKDWNLFATDEIFLIIWTVPSLICEPSDNGICGNNSGCLNKIP